MKIKFLRTLVIVILCIIVFLATTFISSIKTLKQADFLQGFSIGMGAVAIIATIYYYIWMQREKKTGNEQ